MVKRTSKKTGKVFEIAERIVDVGDLPSESKILLYGRSGTGKTHVVGTAPKPLLLIDPKEKGTDTIRARPGVKVIRIDSWQDFEDVYWYLSEAKHPFVTVAVDTVTQLQELAMKAVLGEEPTNVSQRGWGRIASLMKTWIINYRDLPLNVIFTAQDRLSQGDDEDVEDEGTLMPEVGPYVMPSVSKILNSAVGMIGQTFIKERQKTVKTKGGKEKKVRVVEYCLRIGPHAKYLTKFRRDPSLGGGTPEYIVDPTYDKLLALAEGGNDAKE